MDKDREDEFRKNFDWQKMFYPEIERVIRDDLIKYITGVKISTLIEDTQYGYDFSVETINKGTIAVRLRKESCIFREFTLRSKVPSGHLTEFDKIKNNNVNFYLYGWVKGNKINQYVFIDVKKLRDDGFFNLLHNHIPNNDGTSFHSIKLSVIYDYIIHKHNINIENETIKFPKIEYINGFPSF